MERSTAKLSFLTQYKGLILMQLYTNPFLHSYAALRIGVHELSPDRFI